MKMYLQTEKKQKNLEKKFFVGILKVNDNNSRIRILTKKSWIRNTACDYPFTVKL